jgi:hypothetical protein
MWIPRASGAAATFELRFHPESLLSSRYAQLSWKYVLVDEAYPRFHVLTDYTPRKQNPRALRDLLHARVAHEPIYPIYVLHLSLQNTPSRGKRPMVAKTRLIRLTMARSSGVIRRISKESRLPPHLAYSVEARVGGIYMVD